MTTNFPAQIDSFDLRIPQQIIESAHLNDIQEAIVAVQVFSKALEETLNLHLNQTAIDNGFKHDSVEISIADITGLDTTNLQTSLAGLQAQIDTLAGSTSTNLTAHIAADIAIAHPNGTFPGSRIDNSSIDATDKIIAGSIDESLLSFDVATQIELDAAILAHSTTDIATAHPNGTFPVARLDADIATQVELDAHVATDAYSAHAFLANSIPIGVLDTAIATQAELDAHTATSSDVHGVGSDSDVVGTKTAQTLENKKLFSDFVGSKVLLWNESVIDQEKLLFERSGLISAPQLEIRTKSVELVAGVTTLTNTILQVADGSFFTDTMSSSDGVTVYDADNLTTPSVLAQLNSTSATEIELDSIYPTISTFSTPIVVNNLKAKPLFSVNQNGGIIVRELHVEDSAFNDIEFDDDVTITGTLTVTGDTVLQDNLNVSSALDVGTSLVTGTTIQSGLSVTTQDLFITNDADISNNLTVGGDANINQKLFVDSNIIGAGNLIIDGYASIQNDASILGGINVNNFASFGNSVSVGGNLTVGTDASIKQDLEVCEDLSVKGGFITDGYSIVRDDLVVLGSLIISGSITSGAAIDAYAVLFDDQDPANLALSNPITNTDLQDIPIEIQANLEAHIFNPTAAHAATAINFDPSDLTNQALTNPLVSLDLQAIPIELQSNLESHLADGYEAHDGYTIGFDTSDGYNQALANPLTSINLQQIPIELQQNIENAINNILNPWQVVTGTHSALAGERLLADTTSTTGFTITLPASPNANDTIIIADPASSWTATDTLTIARGNLSHSIDGISGDFTANIPNKSLELVYYATTSNWVVIRPSTTLGG